MHKVKSKEFFKHLNLVGGKLKRPWQNQTYLPIYPKHYTNHNKDKQNELLRPDKKSRDS